MWIEFRLYSEADPTTTIRVKRIDVRITNSGNIVCDSPKVQWRFPPRGNYRYGLRKEARLWGGYSRKGFWWAVRKLAATNPDPTKPQLKLRLFRRSLKEIDDPTVGMTFSPGVHAHLYEKGNAAGKKEAKRQETWRRTLARQEYARPAYQAADIAERNLSEVKSEEEAAQAGIMLFRARQSIEYRKQEAKRRWPEDLTLPCPGDAGALGEIALLRSEDDGT